MLSSSSWLKPQQIPLMNLPEPALVLHPDQTVELPKMEAQTAHVGRDKSRFLFYFQLQDDSAVPGSVAYAAGGHGLCMQGGDIRMRVLQ